MASIWTHGSCTTVLNNDRSSLEWGRDYREDPVWQWSWHSKGKRGLTSDRHPWFLITLSHCWLLQSISPPHVSLSLPSSLSHACSLLSSPHPEMPLPLFPCLFFVLFNWSPPTQTPIKQNKNVWNSQGVSWQAVVHSFPVTQPFPSPLSSCVVSPSFLCIHPLPTRLLYFQVVNSSRQRPSVPSLCNQTFPCISVYSIPI